MLSVNVSLCAKWKSAVVCVCVCISGATRTLFSSCSVRSQTRQTFNEKSACGTCLPRHPLHNRCIPGTRNEHQTSFVCMRATGYSFFEKLWSHTYTFSQSNVFASRVHQSVRCTVTIANGSCSTLPVPLPRGADKRSA